MTDKINGRTPEEIKKGLECFITQTINGCDDEPCDKCVCYAENSAIGIQAVADGQALIQQLERERDAAVERCVNADDVSAGYYQEIQQLESAQPKWINAKEHVPADGVDVLVYRDGGFAIAHTVMDDYWTYTGLGGDPEYWMPLPKAPKEG